MIPGTAVTTMGVTEPTEKGGIAVGEGGPGLAALEVTH